jgi:UDP-N-acetylglucosamine--N-acetylmuramyl-(pentapeptide) pyrophosphoryl-undecaprenol N-acetylglucosamine transferase
MERTVLIAAGGTGGHLFPGIAVAEEIRRRDSAARIVFVGTRRGLESRLVPRAGYELETLPVLPLNAVGFVRAFRGACALPWALVRAAGLVLRLRPLAVLGVGGYAGGPVVLAAALLGVPTLVLEPNARPGFTNRVLRPFVRKAACAYEETRHYFGAKGVLTGNPVRGGFVTPPRAARKTPLTLLAFGGSQGSRVLNRTLVEALAYLPGPDRLRIVHQTGEAMTGEVRSAYAAARREATVLPFIDDMEARVAEADLVVARAGATTCAELTTAGRAAVLVPFAGAADDHQVTNARALARGGAARMIEERDLSPESLGRAVADLVSRPDVLQAMEEASRALGRPDAATRVAQLVEQVASGRRAARQEARCV